MVSSFHGLETSKRAILTQSVALNTIGHNISNASTEGYTRQRVNLINASPLSAPGFNRIFTPGQIGSGVEYSSVTRIRDSYLDMQYRRENQEKGMNGIYNTTMEAIQTIVNEPSDNGVSAAMDKFWNSLEVMNRDPNLLSARVDFIGNAKNMADTFNKIGTSLSTLEGDIAGNIDIKLTEANNLIDGISQLNETIRKVEMLGDHANDYRDQRDVLVDKLSKIVDVQYTEDPSGMINVYSGGVQVVNGQESTALTGANVAGITSGEIAGFKKSETDIIKTRDQLNALVDTLINGEVQVTMPNGYKTSTDMVADNDVTVRDDSVVPSRDITYVAGTTIPAGSKITSSAKFTVDGFNGVHRLGYTLNSPAETGLDFFTLKDPTLPFSIDNIEVNPEIQKDTNKVAASGQFEGALTNMSTIKGNSDIALALTSLRNLKFEFPADMTSLSTGTTDDYFRAFVSDLGTRSNIALTDYGRSSDLTDNVEIRRQSTSGVQLDEEMTDMLRFQHAYNAAARSMTAVDEMLDKIINGMGIVGR